MNHGRGMRRAAALVLLAGLTLPATGAWGVDSYKLSRLQPISGANPLPPGCGLKAPPPFRQSDFNPPDTGAEPHAAVDPRDPDNVVAAWTQDFGVTNLTASTQDGGRTWPGRSFQAIATALGGLKRVPSIPGWRLARTAPRT
jgi:hypothetical protein